MKLIFINRNGIQAYFFTPKDSKIIKERCKMAGKQWTDGLMGFFINHINEQAYAAVTVKNSDGSVENMEYLDIEKSKPEFNINPTLLSELAKKEAATEISLQEFEPVLNDILTAPLKARRWEVYPQINEHYPEMH